MRACYLENRQLHGEMITNLAPEIAKHLQKRQHLGTAVVVCERPLTLMCVVRKQWMKLARTLQRERAGTVNAQKILHLTYAVTRMQHLTFVAKTPAADPDADVFFVSPEQLRRMPAKCLSLYLLAATAQDALREAISQMPQNALIIDYVHTTDSVADKLQPKAALTQQVREAWQTVSSFLAQHGIDAQDLAQALPMHAVRLDDALDILLEHARAFLEVASAFQHCLQLAQPLELPSETQKLYGTVALLAHRVQSLSIGEVAQYLDSLTDSSFFLRDGAGEGMRRTRVHELVMYHQAAGRLRLARALQDCGSESIAYTDSTPLYISIDDRP